MGSFDLKNLASFGSFVNHIADGAFGTAKNLQENKTRRIESDNKRKVDTITAAGNVVGNVGTAAKNFGDAYRGIKAGEGELKKAEAEMVKAQAMNVKADTELERTKNDKSKNDQEHIKNMHKIDLDHQEVMDRQAKAFDQACQDNARVKSAMDHYLKTSNDDHEILRQKLKDGSLSASEAELMKHVDDNSVGVVKAILEKRK